MKNIYHILLVALFVVLSQPLFAQNSEEADKIKVVVTDDGVLFNGSPTTMEAVPEQFWQALQSKPGVKYSISSTSKSDATLAKVKELSKMITEYVQKKMLLGGATNSAKNGFKITEENSLQIDIDTLVLSVRVGQHAQPYLLKADNLDSLSTLVCGFVRQRELGGKMLYTLPDGTRFEHTPNDAVVITYAREQGATVDKVVSEVGDAVATAYNDLRGELAQQVASLPYHELDNLSRSVFMAAVPKRTQSNVMQMKVVRQVGEDEDNKKALDLMRMCLLKADGTFAWEGKSYKFEEIASVLGADFDTSKFVLDDPLVAMLMEKTFGKHAPNLNDINSASLLKVLGLSMPSVMGGFVNLMAHSAKVLKENPELVDAYVPITISGLDLVAFDASGNEVQQMTQAAQLQIKFTIVGNKSSRSGNKKLTISLYDVSSGQEYVVQHVADYQNSDLPVAVPLNLTTRLGRGTYLVSVGHGKKLLGAIEVDMMQ